MNMNKEKLEQMKKEKLEQMRELGRGGLTKGLSFLRQSANQALAANAGANGGDVDGSGSGDAGADGPGDGSGANRPSYDDLVALSMKLTRQNKLMKVQFQKLQARIRELQVHEADAALLTAFVRDTVGVDVVACQLLEAKAGADNEGTEGTGGEPRPTIDARQLTERFAIAEAFKQKALKQEIEHLRARLGGNQDGAATATPAVVEDSVSLLPLSPVPPPPPPSAMSVPQYDDIDLLSDPLPPMNAPMVTAESIEPSKPVAVLERQLDEAMEQLHRMETEMRRSAAENEDLRQRFNELWQQRSAQVEQLTGEKTTVEKDLIALQEQVALATEAHERISMQLEAKTQRIEDLESQISEGQLKEAQLREQLDRIETVAATDKDQSDTMAKLAKLQSEHAVLIAATEEMKCARNVDMEKIRTLEKDIQALQEEKAAFDQQLNVATNAAIERANNGRSNDKETIMKLQEQIKLLNAEKACVEPPADTADSKARSVNDNVDNVSAVMQELERVKLELAEVEHAKKLLQEKLGTTEKKLAKTQNEIEQNSAVIEALRGEISHQLDETKRLEGCASKSNEEISRVELENESLKEAKEALEEQLTVLRESHSSNLESVMQELTESKRQVAEQREYSHSKIESLIRDLDESRKKGDELTEQLAEKEKQNQKMASSQTAMTQQLMELQRQVAAMEADLQMAAEGLEAHANRAEQSELRRQEIEEMLKNTKLKMDGLRDQHVSDLELLRSEKESELERLRGEVQSMKISLETSAEQIEELSKASKALKDNLDAERKRTQELESRISMLTAENGNLGIDLAETKKALSDRMALATRLQTENMKYAEKQAEQVARVEAAMREIATANTARAQMEIRVQEAMKERQEMCLQRESAETRMEDLKKEIDAEKRRMADDLQNEEKKRMAAVAAEKEAYKRELERIEYDSKQKSKLALHAVLEKEAEIERLTKRLRELEEDVRSGDADNRKIFEFAQLQANREMEARSNAIRIQELQQELDATRRRVFELQHERSKHGEELTALMQTQRREGVNMEYLKNVIVQYMSFKPGSSQQMRLVPVITTLLQFTAADIKEIKKAGRRSSWATWGAEKTEYKSIPTPKSTSRHESFNSSGITRSDADLAITAPVEGTVPHGSTSRMSSFTLPDDVDTVADPSAFSPHPTQRADF